MNTNDTNVPAAMAASPLAAWSRRPCALAALLTAATLATAAQAQGGGSAAAATTATAAAPAPAAAACPPLLDHRPLRLQDERPQHLCQYAGRVLLVVNTASYCGFTKQFEGLEQLNARYAARGLVVLGFPSNDFRQEDADAKKIADVCFNTYGVKFPMFAVGPVRGGDAQPLFRQLAAATGNAPSWNFNKYLVGRDGVPIAHYGSMTAPTSGTITSAIERALAAPAPPGTR
jgi:glutathione peroxidase